LCVGSLLALCTLPAPHPWVDELPKNASGKVLKRELRRQFGGSESAVGQVSAGAPPGDA